MQALGICTSYLEHRNAGDKLDIRNTQHANGRFDTDLTLIAFDNAISHSGLSLVALGEKEGPLELREFAVI